MTLPMLQGSHRTRATVLTDKQLLELTESLPIKCRDAERWKLCYSTLEHGVSLHTFYHNVFGFENVIVVIMTDRGAVMGAFCPEPLHVEPGQRYFGSRGTFVFHYPDGSLKCHRWARENDYFVYCTHECVGFGGGSGFAILVDSSLLSGSTGRCDTFASPPLVPPSRMEDDTAGFVIYALEVWHVPEYSGALTHLASPPRSPTSAKGKMDRGQRDAGKAPRRLTLRRAIDFVSAACRLPATMRVFTTSTVIAISIIVYSRVHGHGPHPANPNRATAPPLIRPLARPLAKGSSSTAQDGPLAKNPHPPPTGDEAALPTPSRLTGGPRADLPKPATKQSKRSRGGADDDGGLDHLQIPPHPDQVAPAAPVRNGPARLRPPPPAAGDPPRPPGFEDAADAEDNPPALAQKARLAPQQPRGAPPPAKAVPPAVPDPPQAVAAAAAETTEVDDEAATPGFQTLP
jgi:hypothetical protein